jgi:hypothetical protein
VDASENPPVSTVHILFGKYHRKDNNKLTATSPPYT